MSREVVVAFAWMLPHLAALESDFSVFHRVDDMYAMSVIRWARRMSQLPVYGGAFAVAMQDTPAPGSTAAVSAQAEGEMSEAEVKARFRQILIDTYPEHAAGGVKEISADEMMREVGK